VRHVDGTGAVFAAAPIIWIATEEEEEDPPDHAHPGFHGGAN
jgi:hypothetical protein